MFDANILYSHTVDIPTICVGNLSAGGAGKTPHVIYLAKELSKTIHVAVLLRGYRRKTSGFILVNDDSTVSQVGDEALMLHQLLPDIPVAVSEYRVKGIKMLKKQYPELEAVILDDGFQHRQLKCGYYILLTPYDKLYVNDHLLPYGTLREPVSAALRANTIVVTKCPEDLRPIDQRVIVSSLKPYPFQTLVFSKCTYRQPYPLYPEFAEPLGDIKLRPLVLTGIVHPEYIYRDLESKNIEFAKLAFPDHHKFTKSDSKKIEELYKTSHANCILTTEKDAERLRACQYLSDRIKKIIYILPMQIELLNKSNLFINPIIAYVTENNRDR